MLVIVEGIDRVGKTTLCNEINKETNFKIFKYNSLIENKDKTNKYETDKLLLTLEVCKISNPYIIFDRFHLTDFVYGVLQRNYKLKEAYENFEILEKALEKFDNKVVLILVEPVDVERSSKEHGSDLRKHAQLFEALFNESKIKNKIKCNYNTLDEAIKFVKENVNKQCI